MADLHLEILIRAATEGIQKLVELTGAVSDTVSAVIQAKAAAEQAGDALDRLTNETKRNTEEQKAAKELQDHLNAQAKELAKSLNAVKDAVEHVVEALGLYIGLRSAKEMAEEAAEAERLSLALAQVGKNAGFTEGQIGSLRDSLVSLGFTTEQVDKALTKLISIGVDLTKVNKEGITTAVQLGQLAQNLAAVTGRSESQALDLLSFSIARQNDRMLRQIGLRVDLRQAEEKYAQSIGTTVSLLTQEDKAQAFTNEVLQQGTKFAGAYAIFLETVEGKLSKLADSQKELRVAIGNELLPVFKDILDVTQTVVTHFQQVIAAANSTGEGGRRLAEAFHGFLEAIGSVAKTVIDVAVQLLPTFLDLLAPIKVAVDVVRNLFSTLGSLGIGTAIIHGLVFAFEALGLAIALVVDGLSIAAATLALVAGLVLIATGNIALGLRLIQGFATGVVEGFAKGTNAVAQFNDAIAKTHGNAASLSDFNKAIDSIKVSAGDAEIALQGLRNAVSFTQIKEAIAVLSESLKVGGTTATQTAQGIAILSERISQLKAAGSLTAVQITELTDELVKLEKQAEKTLTSGTGYAQQIAQTKELTAETKTLIAETVRLGGTPIFVSLSLELDKLRGAFHGATTDIVAFGAKEAELRKTFESVRESLPTSEIIKLQTTFNELDIDRSGRFEATVEKMKHEISSVTPIAEGAARAISLQLIALQKVGTTGADVVSSVSSILRRQVDSLTQLPAILDAVHQQSVIAKLDAQQQAQIEEEVGKAVDALAAKEAARSKTQAEAAQVYKNIASIRAAGLITEEKEAELVQVAADRFNRLASAQQVQADEFFSSSVRQQAALVAQGNAVQSLEVSAKRTQTALSNIGTATSLDEVTHQVVEFTSDFISSGLAVSDAKKILETYNKTIDVTVLEQDQLNASTTETGGVIRSYSQEVSKASKASEELASILENRVKNVLLSITPAGLADKFTKEIDRISAAFKALSEQAKDFGQDAFSQFNLSAVSADVTTLLGNFKSLREKELPELIQTFDDGSTAFVGAAERMDEATETVRTRVVKAIDDVKRFGKTTEEFATVSLQIAKAQELGAFTASEAKTHQEDLAVAVENTTLSVKAQGDAAAGAAVGLSAAADAAHKLQSLSFGPGFSQLESEANKLVEILKKVGPASDAGKKAIEDFGKLSQEALAGTSKQIGKVTEAGVAAAAGIAAVFLKTTDSAERYQLALSKLGLTDADVQRGFKRPGQEIIDAFGGMLAKATDLKTLLQGLKLGPEVLKGSLAAAAGFASFVAKAEEINKQFANDSINTNEEIKKHTEETITAIEQQAKITGAAILSTIDTELAALKTPHDVDVFIARMEEVRNVLLKAGVDVAKVAPEIVQVFELATARLHVLQEEATAAPLSRALRTLGTDLQTFRTGISENVQKIVDSISEAGRQTEVTGPKFLKLYEDTIPKATTIEAVGAFFGAFKKQSENAVLSAEEFDAGVAKLQEQLASGQITAESYAKSVETLEQRFKGAVLSTDELSSGLSKTEEELTKVVSSSLKLANTTAQFQAIGDQVDALVKKYPELAGAGERAHALIDAAAKKTVGSYTAIAEAIAKVADANLKISQAGTGFEQARFALVQDQIAAEQALVRAKQTGTEEDKKAAQIAQDIVVLDQAQLLLEGLKTQEAIAQAQIARDELEIKKASDADASNSTEQTKATLKFAQDKLEVDKQTQLTIHGAVAEQEGLVGQIKQSVEEEKALAASAKQTADAITKAREEGDKFHIGNKETFFGEGVAESLQLAVLTVQSLASALRQVGVDARVAEVEAQSLFDTFGHTNDRIGDPFNVAGILGAQAAIQDVARDLQRTHDIARDIADQFATTASNAEKLATALVDGVAPIGLLAQGADEVVKALQRAEEQARAAGQAAKDAAGSFLNNVTSIHEELLKAQGDEKGAAELEFASRQKQLAIEERLLEIKIQTAIIEAKAAGLPTQELEGFLAEARVGFLQAKDDLAALEKIELDKIAKAAAANTAANAKNKDEQAAAAAAADSRSGVTPQAAAAQARANAQGQDEVAAINAAQTVHGLSAATAGRVGAVQTSHAVQPVVQPAAITDHSLASPRSVTLNVNVDGKGLMDDNFVNRVLIPKFEEALRRST